MELTGESVNVFVLGDLVLDHFIPATAKQRLHQPEAGERVFDGHPRRTIPGGAANCARLIAALGLGRVCLWGLSGHSPWGSFAEILQKSSVSDRPDRGVIYHGAHNESHRMNTITRLVSIDDMGTRHREFRVDDIDYFPTSDGQRYDALTYLRAEQEQHGIHAIILNDLDMSSLTEPLVTEVGQFAREKNIPIFIDPKRDWHKYREIHATCVLPNLKEWCYIVDDPDGERKWRRDIEHGLLNRLAIRSLRYMPNAEFHLIKCDRLGLVLIAPSDAGHRVVHRVEAHPTRASKLPGQLGAGDILVAALAMEYAAAARESDDNKPMIKALEKALAVVACYLEIDWQQVPTRRDIRLFELQKMAVRNSATIPESVLYLPKADQVQLHKFSVVNSKLVSNDSSYRSKIEQVADFLMNGWGQSEPHSAIVTGRGGIGKSELTEALKRMLIDHNVFVWGDFDPSRANCLDVDSALAQIRAKANELPMGTRGILVVIDEAFSKAPHLLVAECGKMLLQEAAKCKPLTRFLFVDADLERHRSELSESQFLSRCREFLVPALSSRPGDIPYIFGAACLNHLGSSSVRISEAVLLGVINGLLQATEGQQNARNIFRRAGEIVSNVNKTVGTVLGQIEEISKRHLTVDLQVGLEETEPPRHFYQFSW